MRTNDDSLSVKPRRTHVRSGCRTCKLRKVKCDEGRPACHRCVSSGRTCSGYGIWGGGGNVHTHRASSVLHKEDSTALPPAPVTLIGATKEERGLFDWFRTETRTKFPGLFVLDFWDSVVIQACQQEPAVRHAVFCLSLVHKSIVLGNKIESSANGPGNEIEQRVIYQYNKAIRNLAPHFSSKERDSTRIALIACLIFVSLEHLRGRFEAAEFHLKNGVKIFSELQAHSKSEEGGTTKLKKSSFNLTDNCIFQAFSRMNVQVELFKQTLPHSLILLPDVDHGHPVSVFSNRNEAWMYLERLMNKVFHLIQQCSQARNDDGKSPGSLDSVVKDQRRIREELEQWYATFECSRRFIIGNDVGPCICDLLHNYFVVTSIMLETALHPVVDESIYDLYTQDFLSVVEHSSGIFGRGIGPWLKLNSAISNDISKSSVDNGWVVPLYFTAIKCRVHRIRVHAIRLLESLAHREGIWDSRITSSIARRVMEYEERDFFDNHDIDDDFELTDVPELQDLTLPILPASYRIAGHKVLLQNNVNGTVSIHYQQNLVTEEWHELEVPIRKYGLFPYEKKQDLSSDNDLKMV